MKRIACDLCDGVEFIKKDGVFICQGCGTKYSLAEARSIMQDIEEDTVPVAEISSEELMCYEAGVAAFVKAEKTWANLEHPSHKDLTTYFRVVPIHLSKTRSIAAANSSVLMCLMFLPLACRTGISA